MGILDFARDIGRQLFDRDEVAAQSIKDHLDIRLTPIRDLAVGYDEGVVTLTGECLDQTHREQAILLAGNVKGVEKVVSDGLRAPAPTPEVPEERIEFYEIQRGDSLSAIAKRYYGDAMGYPRIFEANRDVIGDPNKIYPGQMIRIPLG